MSIEREIENITQNKKEEKEGLDFFDAEIWLGKPDFFPLAPELNAGDLAGVLDEFSINGALLSHWDAVTLSAQDCNQALAAAGNDLPADVYTVWTGLPLTSGEQGPLPGRGSPDPLVRGVRLFPKTHNFSLSEWAVGGLCEWCMEYAVPVFFWHVEVEWDSVYRLAKRYPDLKIIVETQWQKILYQIRNLYALMDCAKNVYVELSNFVGQDFVTNAVRKFGAERLIFGSFIPVNDPHASMGMIMDADITEEEKRLIAGKNLKRIIGGGRA
jgi:hypothetical protein